MCVPALAPPLLLCAGALLAGCGEKKLEIDEALVEDRLDRVDEQVPLCDAPPSANRSLRVASREIRDLARRARSLRAVLPRAGLRANGSCGGSLDVTSEHAQGDTDYVATFAAFCTTTGEGQLVLDGVVLASQDGTPSDAGPVVEALEVSTDGVLEATLGTQALELSLDGGRTEYGNPAAYLPEAPDEDHPDVITVERASVVYPNDGGREDFVRGVEIEVVGGQEATVRILDGDAVTAGEGRVDLRTPDDDPVVIDRAGMRWTGGTIELLGTNDSVLAIAPDPAEAGSFVLTLNGAPYDRGVDCSAGRGPLLEVALAFLTEVPVY